MSDSNDFDLQKTLELHELFQIPREERDEEWIKDFFDAAPNASLRGFEPQIQRGPDGFPYLMLSLPESGEEFDAFSVSDSVEYCLKTGCGIALFAGPKDLSQPEWVFTFGNLWSYNNYGNFIGDPSDELPTSNDGPLAEETLTQPREIQVGAPSEEFLPPFARAALNRFIRDTTGIQNPRVAYVMDPILKPTRALMFADLHPDNFEQKEQFLHYMQALRWFLPATRGLMASVPQINDHAVPL